MPTKPGASVNDETAPLFEQNNIKAFLSCEDGAGTGCRIFTLEGDRVIIGRSREGADMVVENRAVGRLQAEIIRKEGAYFLMDRNSKNGTYMDGKKLEAWIEYRLSDGCVIAFANVEYKFAVI